MRKYILVIVVPLLILTSCGKSEKEELKEKVEEQQEVIMELRESLEEAQRDAEFYKFIVDRYEEDDDSDVEDLISEYAEDESDKEREDNVSNIDSAIHKVVNDELDNTTVIELDINDNASKDDEGYIAIVDLEWSVKNKPKTTKDMLDRYSDHLAASIADDKLINELVIFWTVPYHNEDETILKRAYENEDEGMYLVDEMKDVNTFD